jgi:hypothetical protein
MRSTLTLESILVALPLHSGGFKGRLARRYAAYLLFFVY